MLDSRPPLHEYQQTGVEWLRSVGRGLLGDEPGLGKSRQLIEASTGRTLVVAPAMVITGGTWRDEIARWADDPSRFTIAPYTSLNKRVKTGNGSATRPTDAVKPEYLKPWDTLIVDEAHYIKGRKTSWTKAVSEIATLSDRVYLATGTPIANWAPELFTLLRVLNPEQAKRGQDLGSYWRWVGTWFHTQPSQYNPEARDILDLKACTSACYGRPAWKPCKHYRAFTDANLGAQFLRRLRDDCLDLPPITEQTISTPMSAAGRRAYNQLKRDYYTWLEDEPEALVAWSTGSRNVMLDMCTVSDWFLREDPQTPPAGGKLECLRVDLKDRSRPTLVLAHHKRVVEACAAVAQSVGASTAYVHGGVSKTRAAASIERFKAGKLDVLVGSLETLAEGLTLVAADTAIFVERSYKPYRNVQARRRIHRLGQTRPVTVREYITPNSLDSRKQALLDTKTDRQMRFLSARDFAELL